MLNIDSLIQVQQARVKASKDFLFVLSKSPAKPGIRVIFKGQRTQRTYIYIYA